MTLRLGPHGAVVRPGDKESPLRLGFSYRNPPLPRLLWSETGKNFTLQQSQTFPVGVCGQLGEHLYLGQPHLVKPPV